MPYQSTLIGSTYVVIWQKPELGDVRVVVDEVGRARRRAGKPLLYIAYIPDATATPEGPVRDAMSRSMSAMLEDCESIVFVLEGTGFRVSIGRAALAGIMLASGHRGRVHILATIEEAASRVTDHDVLAYLRSARGSARAE